MKRISLNKLKKINNPIMIDIRNLYIIKFGTFKIHIDNIIFIPNEELLKNPSQYLNKINNYYLFCEAGITSLKTCKILRKQGYKVYSVKKGYKSLSR